MVIQTLGKIGVVQQISIIVWCVPICMVMQTLGKIGVVQQIYHNRSRCSRSLSLCAVLMCMYGPLDTGQDRGGAADLYHSVIPVCMYSSLDTG